MLGTCAGTKQLDWVTDAVITRPIKRLLQKELTAVRRLARVHGLQVRALCAGGWHPSPAARLHEQLRCQDAADVREGRRAPATCAYTRASLLRLQLDLRGAVNACSIRQFDEALVVKALGYDDVEDYYQAQSSRDALKVRRRLPRRAGSGAEALAGCVRGGGRFCALRPAAHHQGALAQR